MKKAFKIIVKTLVWVAVLVVLALLTLPLWVGPVVRTAANAVTPKYTGTDFNLGAFGLNYYTGYLHVGDMRLDNPEGYRPVKAATLGSLDVDVDMSTVLSDTIVIRDILVKDVFVSMTSKGGTNNFAAIAAYATKDSPKAGKSAEKDEEPASSGTGRKVVVDRIRLEGVSMQYEMIPIPLPTITLKDIGRESNGVEFKDAWFAIWDAVQKSVTTVGGGLINLGTGVIEQGTNFIGAGIEGAASAVDATGKALNKASDAVDSAAEKIKDVGKSFKGLFGK